MTSSTFYGSAVVAALAVGCYHHADDDLSPPLAGAAAPLVVAPVAWNPSNVDVGTVQAAVEIDSSVLVLGTNGALTMSAGALVSSDATLTAWRSAAVVSSPDGVTQWTVGVDGAGHLQRLVSGEPPEDVSDRYGFAADPKVQALASGANAVAFLADGALAVTDGTSLTRYPVSARSVAANGARVAVADGSAVRIWEGGEETDVSVADAQLVTFDGAGALYVATTHAFYKLTGTTTAALFDAGTRTIHQLAGAGSGVWLAVDGDLARFDGSSVAVASGGTLAADAHLVGSASGDVWAVSGGVLTRWSAGASGANADETLWNTAVQPVFAAVCSNCHSPPGSGKDSSHIDLSTYAAWSSQKSAIYTRVVTDAQTPSAMPPPTSQLTLTDDQRSAIAAWAKP